MPQTISDSHHQGHTLRAKFLFSPQEMFFCGYSNSGKTTLLKKVVAHLRAHGLEIGYVKHDAHAFAMDHEGKDTWILWNAGATPVSISDQSHSALITNGPLNSRQRQIAFDSSDIVLVEGYKNLPYEKILLLREGEETLVDELEHVVAVVGASHSKPLGIGDKPYFHRDDSESIAAFVREHVENRIRSRPLCGLILAGGRSQRMGEDKAWLSYQGKPQLQRLFETLKNVTSEVFVSCRSSQWEGESHASFIHSLESQLLPDRFVDFGPLGGILSALIEHPEKAFLVTAVDMPFLNETSFLDLLASRQVLRSGTCYINPDNGFIEPLCGIYEAKIRSSLLLALGSGSYCPRKILRDLKVATTVPCDVSVVSNINHQNEYLAAHHQLQNCRIQADSEKENVASKTPE